MSRRFNEELVSLVRDLVKLTIPNETNHDRLQKLENDAITKLEAADSMVFLNKKQMDTIMSSLSDKYAFHGFIEQSKDLIKLYNRYIPENLPKNELMNRLNIVKFLTAVCERPTSRLAEDPHGYKRKEEVEEIIDWPTYLQEGIERWSPPPDVDDESEEWSEDETSLSFLPKTPGDSSSLNLDSGSSRSHLNPINIKFSKNYVDYTNASTYVKENVQNTWFNLKQVAFCPSSTSDEARYGIKWEDHIEEKTYGLLPRSNILREYHIVREVIWACFTPTDGLVIECIDKKWVPKKNVTISSVPQPIFFSFMESFMVYINTLQELREFYEKVWDFGEDILEHISVPDVFKNYAVSYKRNIIYPIYNQLAKIEKEVIQQESTTTLLWLAEKFTHVFQPLFVLKNIHKSICNLDLSKTFDCATKLFRRLHFGLQVSVNKLEQDIYLSLYIESLSKYIRLIDFWFRNGKWADRTEEFVIISCPDEMTWENKYRLREMDQETASNDIIKIICTDVLQIGKNIKLLHSLKKFDLIETCRERLYDVFVNEVLVEINNYFGSQESEDLKIEVEQTKSSEIVNREIQNNASGTLNWLVPLDNFFLNMAFKKDDIPEEKKVEDVSLYERVSSTTKSQIPAADKIVVKAFYKILDKYKYVVPSVKSLVATEYKLKEHLNLLANIYIFKDDMIFPLYRRIFDMMNSKSDWGNSIWLTSHMQDILMDFYPDFYDRCRVTVGIYWKYSKSGIDSCDMIDISYRIEWPISIIVQKPQLDKYQKVFKFVLKIKWALYTLNHLNFSKLEPKISNKKKIKHYKNIPQRLRILRFKLLNYFTALQHFILGLVCYKLQEDFEKKIENAYSLDGLIEAHKNYIDALHLSCVEMSSESFQFKNFLDAVESLSKMWADVVCTDEELLSAHEKLCQDGQSEKGFFTYMKYFLMDCDSD